MAVTVPACEITISSPFLSEIRLRVLANREIRGILRAVSKLTAEMPMRHAWLDACRKRHWSVGTRDARMRRVRRHPDHPDACLFLSAEFNPDDDDNQDDCNQNAHWPSPPFPAFPGRGLRPMTQRHPAVSALNILSGDGFVKSQNKIILASNFHGNLHEFMRILDKILNP